MSIGEIRRSATEIRIGSDAIEREALVIGAGSVAEKGGGGKVVMASGSRAGLRPADSRERLSPHVHIGSYHPTQRDKNAAPLLGPRFKEVKVGRRWSGKAMEVAVSQGEAALREMVTGDEVEGHFLGCGLFSTVKPSTCRTKD